MAYCRVDLHLNQSLRTRTRLPLETQIAGLVVIFQAAGQIDLLYIF